VHVRDGSHFGRGDLLVVNQTHLRWQWWPSDLPSGGGGQQVEDEAWVTNPYYRFPIDGGSNGLPGGEMGGVLALTLGGIAALVAVLVLTLCCCGCCGRSKRKSLCERPTSMGASKDGSSARGGKYQPVGDSDDESRAGGAGGQCRTGGNGGGYGGGGGSTRVPGQLSVGQALEWLSLRRAARGQHNGGTSSSGRGSGGGGGGGRYEGRASGGDDDFGECSYVAPAARDILAGESASAGGGNGGRNGGDSGVAGYGDGGAAPARPRVVSGTPHAEASSTSAPAWAELRKAARRKSGGEVGGVGAQGSGL